MRQTMGSVKVVAGITLLLGVGAAAIFARVATSGSAGMQEIRLEVHDMTYYIDGQNDPNPTLHVRRGEHVRILLRNADAGMSHDFSVRAWRTGTRLVHGLGEAAVEFTAPDTVGEETYACTPHGDMMHGTIRIE